MHAPRLISLAALPLLVVFGASACSSAKSASPLAPTPLAEAAPPSGAAGNPATPPPPPSAPRAPNPPDGHRLPLPDMFHVVREVAASHPDALRHSCQEHGGSWEFMDRVVDRLRQHDTRWGYNGKRGNNGDPSLDVIDYNYGAHADEGTTEVYIIDIVVGHCGSNPAPAWIDQTGATAAAGSIGRWTSRGRF
jgi:hypothetical protein